MTRFYHSSVPHCRSFSEKLLHITSLALLSGILFLAGSCEEDATTIGENILPESDLVSIFSTDTIRVRSFTMYNDSIRSDNPLYSYLGQIYDPYFGTTTAEFVSQMRLYPSWDYDVFTIDSIKLFLSFTNVTGNTNAGHILRLSEISEQIYPDSVYYSNKSVPLTGYSLDLQLPELQADTVNNLVLTVPPESGFGAYITRNPSMLFHDNSIPDFVSYFKGFYFQLIPAGSPAFITTSVAQAQQLGLYDNYFVLYLHDGYDVQSEFLLVFDSFGKGASFNLYKHDYTTGEPGKRFDDRINKDILDTLTYLQGLNGVYTRILLPGLNSIKNNPLFDNISVNKARLVYPYLDTEDAGNFPSQLLMRYSDNIGNRYYFHTDANSRAFFNGTIDTVAGVYNFNIGSFIQKYLDDEANSLKPDLDLYIPSNSTLNAIMRANQNSKPVKFEFTYTKF